MVERTLAPSVTSADALAPPPPLSWWRKASRLISGENLSPSPEPQVILKPMSRIETRPFFNATPLVYWPVLMWNLYWMLRFLDRQAETQRFLVRIHTDGRGRFCLEWIATPERPSPWELSHKTPVHELYDLDFLSGLSDAAQQCGTSALARSVTGDTLTALIAAAGFSPNLQPEPG